MYTYGGAKSRKLRLQFPITLQHVLAETVDVGVYGGILKYTRDGKTAELKKFKSSLARIGRSSIASSEDTVADTPAAVARRVFEIANPAIGASDRELSNLFTDFFDAVNVFADNDEKSKPRKDLDSVINVILWWINIIRSSVTNSSKNPVNGPPIVRLFHGILYSNVPCVVKSYNISYDEMAGKDLRTFMDNRILVSMELEEVRAGDFQEFEPGDPVKGHNLAGWEELMEEGTMDPFITLHQWSEHVNA